MDLQYALQLVRNNGNRIQMVDNPTPEIRETAIRRTPTAIQHIADPTTAEQELAIEVQGDVDREGIFELVEMIQNIDPSILDKTIDINGNCIKLIEDPTYQQQVRAVDRDGDAIRFIDAPDQALQLLAVGHGPEFIKHITDPEYDVVSQVILRNPRAIEHVKNPHVDHQERVLKECPDDGLVYINNIDHDLALKHIKDNPEQIELLQDQFEEACWVALNENGNLLKSIRNPTPEMISYARLVSDGT